MVPDADQSQLAAAADIARDVLLRDAAATDAVIALGLAAQIENRVDAARTAFHYAERLSRRELQTQLWAIVDLAGQGDIPGVIRQYDIALRTAPGAASERLFPALSSVLSDPQVRRLLVERLGRDPAWRDRFLGYAARDGEDPEAAQQLFTALDRAHVPVPEPAKVGLISSLIAADKWDSAWSYYQTLHPQANRASSQDPDFRYRPKYRSLFDWVPVAQSGIAATIGSGGDGGVFTFSTPPGVGGTVLRQMEVLPPGEYVVEGVSERIDQPDVSRPYWQLSCYHGSELGRVELPNSDRNGGRFSGRFMVPEDCPAQVLTLVTRASDDIAGVEGQIAHVQIRPAGE
ncbi:tetratricopeptide repeat protein [Stakelama saccharophila]|uniref:Uncharacterized protein n=1 Tax=Stakelama saccharophila TaxID=3075605 RepID=A0ABZ0B9J0_9SPHN|nr:hypothetical protein [Stakelama sp. W311]WNO53776.1 hypothetical protein RPR59_00475 [Stakelama sp. W311]